MEWSIIAYVAEFELVKSSRLEKSSCYIRKRVSGVCHTQCMHHIGCTSKAVSSNMVKFSKVHVSRSSQSEKSSQYNRKRASRAHHTKCMHHIGCSSKAASGNVVKYNIDGVLHTYYYINSFANFWGGGMGSTNPYEGKCLCIFVSKQKTRLLELK